MNGGYQTGCAVNMTVVHIFRCELPIVEHISQNYKGVNFATPNGALDVNCLTELEMTPQHT